MRDMFGESIGLWNIKVNGSNFDLKPEAKDLKTLRNIMFDKKNRNDMTQLLDKFEQFMFDLIKREYKEQEDERIKEFITLNSMELFKIAQIQFKFAREEDFDKATQKAEEDLKKEIEGA